MSFGNFSKIALVCILVMNIATSIKL